MTLNPISNYGACRDNSLMPEPSLLLEYARAALRCGPFAFCGSSRERVHDDGSCLNSVGRAMRQALDAIPGRGSKQQENMAPVSQMSDGSPAKTIRHADAYSIGAVICDL